MGELAGPVLNVRVALAVRRQRGVRMPPEEAGPAMPVMPRLRPVIKANKQAEIRDMVEMVVRGAHLTSQGN